MNAQPQNPAQSVQNHMEDIKEELKLLLFHKETVKRKIELLRPKIESKIVRPLKTSNLANISKNDLDIDVVPANLADLETIRIREEFYYATMELANVGAAIDAKTNLYNSYKEHWQREFKQKKEPCTDAMLYDAFNKAWALTGLSKSEIEVLDNIARTLPDIMKKGEDARNEVLETLQGLIKQYS
jgi:hypothetical protein